jgi:putative ABC transport system substrate-binding protein
LNVALHPFGARGAVDFDDAFAAMAKARVDAIMVLGDAMLNVNARAAAECAAPHQLPSIGFSEFAELGGLIGYGPNLPTLFRRAAYFVDKILKGAKPADLPVEQPTRFDLVIDRKTAQMLGLTIPQSLLLRADEVIQ